MELTRVAPPLLLSMAVKFDLTALFSAAVVTLEFTARPAGHTILVTHASLAGAALHLLLGLASLGVQGVPSRARTGAKG